jgi:hypothetical protein
MLKTCLMPTALNVCACVFLDPSLLTMIPPLLAKELKAMFTGANDKRIKPFFAANFRVIGQFDDLNDVCPSCLSFFLLF